ncbi:CAP domain-containing protein [Streptomyces sp. NPDC046985]|uniref:CAP domain-containing protein n=1 Tax=Streptomyces sp. NPDC046985 TaxID=3155377 RepID=UPI0033F1DA27
MGKHRQQSRYRRIVIAAAAVGMVGIPSAAMACTYWPQDKGGQTPSATEAPSADWWNVAPWNHSGDQAAALSAPVTLTAASTAPTVSASTAPKPTTLAHSHRAKRAAHRHRHTWRAHTPAAPVETATASAPTTSSPTAVKTATARPTAAPSAAASQTPTAAAPTPAAPSSSAPASVAPASGTAARIVELVNAERSKVGCSPLTLNSVLTKAAQAHSDDMAAHQNMSHTGSDGSDPGDRITKAGYTWSSYGENIAYGYGTPEQVMAGWMASPGHKANILNCGFKEIGVGLAQPGSYWTQDFGAAR